MGTAIALVFVAIPAVAARVTIFKRHGHVRLWQAAGPSLVGALVFLIPYVLWSQGALSSYTLAKGFAIAIAGGSGVAVTLYVQRLSRSASSSAEHE
jgi:hypothetical protein